jgi:acyl-CoA thioester hydrolase
MQFPKRLAVLASWSKHVMRRRPAPERLADYPLVCLEKLRFADTDRNGHISNAVFSECCQNARMELLYDEQRLTLPPASQFVIARLDLQFLAEMHWPGTVRVGTRVTRIGRCSVVLQQALFLGDRRVAAARSTVVLIDAHTRLPRQLSPELVEALRDLHGRSARRPALVARLAQVLQPRTGRL